MIKKTEEKGKVIRICDRCGGIQKVNLSTIQKSKKYRKRQKDLCISCGTKDYYERHPQPVGNQSPQWKGGINKGYQFVYWRDPVTGKSRKESEQRLVMRQSLGRDFKAGEVVHHIDLNKINNEIDNLYLCLNEHDHQKVHHSAEQCGFVLLGRSVWFNYETLRYEICRCSKPECSFSNDGINGRRSIRSFGDNLYEFCRQGEKERPLHVLLIENRIQRKLYHNEVVHHIDGNGLNNDMSNIVLMTISEHVLSHKGLQQCVGDLIEKGVVFDGGEYSVEISVDCDRHEFANIRRQEIKQHNKKHARKRQTTQEYSCRYREKNREQLADRQRSYYRKNKDVILQKAKEFRRQNNAQID